MPSPLLMADRDETLPGADASQDQEPEAADPWIESDPWRPQEDPELRGPRGEPTVYIPVGGAQTQTSYGPARTAMSPEERVPEFVQHVTPMPLVGSMAPNDTQIPQSQSSLAGSWHQVQSEGSSNASGQHTMPHVCPPGLGTSGMMPSAGVSFSQVPANVPVASSSFVPQHAMCHGVPQGHVPPHHPVHPHMPMYGPGVYGVHPGMSPHPHGFPGAPPCGFPGWNWFGQVPFWPPMNMGMQNMNPPSPLVSPLDSQKPQQSEPQSKKESEGRKKKNEGEDPKKRKPKPSGGGVPPSSNGSSSSPPEPTESEVTDPEDSSADTSAIRSMLKRRVKSSLERPKSSLGSVKIEEFAGERYRYLKWKKAVEAQQQLYRLDEEELAMLVYLSTKRDARDCLDQTPIQEFTKPGGLRLVWRLLDEAFGESEEELFERAEKEYALYRRLPGQTVAAYIGQMKRLKAQYQRVDPETQISDRAWAQRLLNRCSLSRRERLDVFFSAGGVYEPKSVERALRHRCSNTHEDERRIPSSKSQKVSKPKNAEGGDRKKPGFKKSYKRAYVTDEVEGESEKAEEEEDLEEEHEAYVERSQQEEDEDAEGLDPIKEEEEGNEESEEEEILEAYAAGWKAKAKMNERKKQRGWSQGSPKPKDGGQLSIAQKKQASTCASCGARGHWKGDGQCPNVKSGKDKPHQRKEASSGGSQSQIHFTYAVTTTSKRSKVKTEESEKEKSEDVHHGASCKKCRWPIIHAAKFCSQCGSAIEADERMAEGKRSWHVVSPGQEVDEVVDSSSEELKGTPPRTYPLRKGLLKEAGGRDEDKEKNNETVRASPEEVLAALPLMSRDEKKKIQKALQKEEEKAAYTHLERHHRLLMQEDPGTGGASASTDQMPVAPSVKKEEMRHGGYMETARKTEVPKKVKERMLSAFREELYSQQLKKNRLIPSQCAPTPNEEQVRCCHPYEKLRWSSNGDGHYASCRACGLKHVIYFSERHGTLVAHQEVPSEHNVLYNINPGMAIMDSGCRTSVAGIRWHEEFQKLLQSRGLTWHEEVEDETFKFGAGDPEVSQRAFIYPIGIHGHNDLVRMSCVGGGASDCPGLIGPSEMSRWGVVMDFAARKICMKDTWKPMLLTATRHPAVFFLDFADVRKFWESPEICEVLELLQRSPQSWAFNVGAEDESSEGSGGEEAAEKSEGSSGEETDEETKQKERWKQALEKLDEDLAAIPVLEFQRQESSEEEDWELVTEAGAESITSHEFGVQWMPEDEGETSEESEIEDSFVGIAKHFSKHQKGEVRHAVKEVKTCYIGEKTRREKPEKTSEVLWSQRKRNRCGPWRVLEIFTWTCMISMCAVQRGNWEMLEPVTLPNWNLLEPDDRAEALAYLHRADPDLLVIAWPCTYWSILQELGRKTGEQLQQLAEKREEHRALLDFVKEAAIDQRKRGGALLGENPLTSRAWKEPAIVQAFEGMPEVSTDMCRYGLRKPKKENYYGKAQFLRKRTRLQGTAEILEKCSRKCQRGHQHAPVLGSVKVYGKWKSLSDFAGGYTAQFAKCVLDGAEEYLKKGRVCEVFVEDEYLPEESFVPLEDEEAGAIVEATEEVKKEQKLGQLELIHRRLGHPANETLVRMLRLAGAERWLVDEASKLECPVCESSQMPRRPMPQRSDMRPTTFNELVAIDLKFAKDCNEVLYVALSMVDLATNFHQGVLLRNRNPGHVAQKFLSRWISVFGIPQCITLDQGGEWEAEFLMLLEQHAVATRFTGSHAAWQLGHAERHGALLGVSWGALVHEYQVIDRAGMKITLLCALQAKNQVVSRRGFNANSLVFGRQCNLPDLLDDDATTSTTLGQALATDSEVARQAEMRAFAKRALLHKDAQEKLKQVLLRKPGGQIREFLPGEKIFFWVPGVKKTRYKKDAGNWRGPAVVLVKESHEKYFVSWRGRCLLLAAANMRGATVEENADPEEGLEELRRLEGKFQEGGGYEDLGDLHRDAEKKEEDGVWQAVEDGVQAGRRKGRSRREAVEMMRGLRSVKKLLKTKFGEDKPQGRPRGRPRIHPVKPKIGARKKNLTEEDQEVMRQAERDLEDFNRRFPDEEVSREEKPEEKPEDRREETPEPSDDEEFWDEVQKSEEAYAKEEEERLREASSRRQRLLDDVPACLKRKSEEQPGTMEAKFRRQFFQQLEVMTAENHLPEKILKLMNVQKDGKQNLWLPKQEVKLLGRLLNLPVTAARLHRAPRKKLQETPNKKARRRITVMLLENPGEALVVDEDVQQMKTPRKRASAPWRGMTLFVRDKKSQKEEKFEEKRGEKEEAEVRKAYVQIGEEVFAAKVGDWQSWNELVEREKVWQCYKEALILRLKASGKELDPKWFNEEEAKKFQESDVKEWEAWIKNGVIERLTPEQAAKVPKDAVFKIPLRMVRVNKSKEDDVLQPKSRLVVPGHMDPGLGLFRTDSPTAPPVAIRMMKSLMVTLAWSGYTFDVSTAFLSGKNTDRLVFARAPPEGLPGTDSSAPVKPYELMRIVKSAYGLAEAPRLWYLRAVEILQLVGMVELPFCRSVFIAKDSEGEVYAWCALHVDDGLFIGNPQEPLFEALRRNIDNHFNIKSWEELNEDGIDYLGMKVKYFPRDRVLVDDMTAYVLQIQPAPVPEKGKLGGQTLTNYRQLVMKMRWPVQHVLPEYMYKISALAQRVTKATHEDVKEANSLLAEMQELARNGGAKLQYRPLEGEICFVTYFDASLGRTKDGTAQQGELHLMTDVLAMTEERNANLIEYHSNKISRVVRSSMAAESCALTGAADKQLYNRLLYESLRNGKSEVSSEWRESLQTQGIVVTDAKSLFDHCHRTGHMAQERQTALDLLMCKRMIEEKLLILRWVPTFRQLADSLTKAMKDVLIGAYKKIGKICLISTSEDEAEEQRRSAIRRGQRERRSARAKQSSKSSQQVLFGM